MMNADDEEFDFAGSVVGSQPRHYMPLGDRATADVAYLNVPSASSVTTTSESPTAEENPITPGSRATTGNPVAARSPAVAGSAPGNNSSAATYYNIPKTIQRNSCRGGQAEQSNFNSLPSNITANPPVPRRYKILPAQRNCVVKNSPRDAASHSYYTFAPPPSNTDSNRVPPPGSRNNIARSKSLGNIRFSSSPSRKDKPAVRSNNNATNSSGGRLRRRYSVGDIIHKLHAFVSSGLPTRRGFARSMSRFSVTHSASPESKVSSDRSPAEDAFWSPGLKQRSASEILHVSSRVEDLALARKSPSPEKDVPPVPPPRLVVWPKPPAKTKVFRDSLSLTNMFRHFESLTPVLGPVCLLSA